MSQGRLATAGEVLDLPPNVGRELVAMGKVDFVEDVDVEAVADAAPSTKPDLLNP